MLRTGGRAGDQDSGVHIGSRGAVNTGDQGYNSLHMREKAIKKREKISWRWAFVGLDMYWLSCCTAYAMSG